MKPVLNVSAYRFVTLDDPAALRDSLHAEAASRGLRGTVLLAAEGINLVLAGAPAALRGFVDWLRRDARFEGLTTRDSESDAVPFGRLLVKVKPEIIRMNQPAVRPQQRRAPAVDAATLARWLDHGGRDDAGRPVLLLDTRNGFEVDHGRFAGAVDWRLSKFSDFPAALAANAAQLRGHTVVSYCTGGIRCEKAALWMADAGVDHVLQLDGGILDYLRVSGGRHFDGSCFVFDERLTVGAAASVAPAG